MNTIQKLAVSAIATAALLGLGACSGMTQQEKGTAVGAAQTLAYDNTGVLQTPAGGMITFPAYTPATGAAPMALTFDFGDTTQYGQNFTVNGARPGARAQGASVSVEINLQAPSFVPVDEVQVIANRVVVRRLPVTARPVDEPDAAPSPEVVPPDAGRAAEPVPCLSVAPTAVPAPCLSPKPPPHPCLSVRKPPHP